MVPGEFVVQLGAFVDSAVARDLAAKAGEQGYSVFLEAVTTKSGRVQRVRVGPFATRGDADAAAAKLKAAGFTAVARPRSDAVRR
jgi:DedD protein